MDGYFLRPVPVFTQLLLSQFNVNAIGDIAVGASTLGVAITLVHLHWTVGKGLYMAAAVIGGLLVEAALQLMLSCLLLRSPGSRVLGSWVDELMSTFGNYPLSIALDGQALNITLTNNADNLEQEVAELATTGARGDGRPACAARLKTVSGISPLALAVYGRPIVNGPERLRREIHSRLH